MNFHKELDKNIEIGTKENDDMSFMSGIYAENSMPCGNIEWNRNISQEKFEKLIMLPSRNYSKKEREKIKKKETKILKLKRNWM